ncbi:MAG: haloacid dehalogenase-like hydrolase [Lachnospiraceae bacterium]|nr:haloacid dehalogenase-like hydrolase [Lachnospiraceae bacterium]
MAKRMLDCYASDFAHFTKKDLLESIAKSEGRVLACETIGTIQPMLGNVTNAEFVAAMGADILLLNMFDVLHPEIKGLPKEYLKENPKEIIHVLKRLTGRPVGINLEPAEGDGTGEVDDLWKMSEGRRATLENAERACEMGVDMILLTGNPGMGVSNEAIERTLQLYHKNLGDKMVLAAGKMHAAGILEEAAENIMTADDVTRFCKAGADIILLPAPGTVPGITMEYVRGLVSHAHREGVLTMTAIGTSQEGADVSTIRQLALLCKMTGTDIHHLGDAGYAGMSLPENIQAYSVAVRGIRHTYHRMAASIER